MFGTGGETGEAADAVGVAHEGLVRHIDIHRTCGRALITMDAGILIAADTDEAQNTQEAAARTTHADIVAEGALEEEAHKEKSD